MPTERPGVKRFGLLACSRIARRRFLPALRDVPGARLHHVGSRDPEKARPFATEFGAPHAGTYEDVLNDPEVQYVYISTPPGLHEYWSKEAARRGKHVLCEKPSALSEAGAAEVLRVARDHGVCVMQGFMARYHPQHEEFRRRLAAGAVGDLALVTGEFTYPRPVAGDIRFQRELAGGVTLDSGGYPVAAAMGIAGGPPVRVAAQARLDPEAGVECEVAITLAFASGASALLFSGYGLHYRSRLAALGSGGRLELERAYAIEPTTAPVLQVETAQGVERVTLPPADQFRLMIEHFLKAVERPDLRAELDHQFLLQCRVMDAVRRAIDTGQPVRLESAAMAKD